MSGSILLGDNYTLEEDSTGDLVITDADGTPVISQDNDANTLTFNDPILDLVIQDSLTDAAGVSHSGELADASDVVSDHGNLNGLVDDDHTQYLLVDGTRAMTGALDTPEVQNQDYNEAVDTRSAVSGTQDLDLSTANWFEIEADGDITISFSNVTSTPPGNSLVIYLEDSDGTGPHTVSWPASVTWSGGTVEDTIPSNDDIEITLLSPDGGSSWRARKSGESFS